MRGHFHLARQRRCEAEQDLIMADHELDCPPAERKSESDNSNLPFEHHVNSNSLS